jgi:hypothetical protein
MSSPDRCANCDAAIRLTDIGHVHVDVHGQDRGWLCPSPHMTLATRTVDVMPDRAVPQTPPLPYRKISPNWRPAAGLPREAAS